MGFHTKSNESVCHSMVVKRLICNNIIVVNKYIIHLLNIMFIVIYLILSDAELQFGHQGAIIHA